MRSIFTRRFLLSSLKWLLSAAMLFYALHEIDRHAVSEMLTRQNPLVPAVVVGLVMLQAVISSFRWQRIVTLLSDARSTPPIAQMVRLNFISAFFNSCLPGTIGGDMVRAMMLRSDAFPLSVCAHSVILDRMVAVLAVFLMVGAGLPWLRHLLPGLPVETILLCALLATGVGLAVLFFVPSLLETQAHRPVMRVGISVLHSLQALVRRPADLCITTLQAVAGHACLCISVFLLAESLGSAITLAECMILVPPVLLLMMLPVSFGGWGVRELSMVGFLALAGVGKEASITISVQLGILASVGSLPGVWLYLKRKR